MVREQILGIAYGRQHVAGGSDHTHLINFDVSIVRPFPNTTRLLFVDLGDRAGSCTLTCHGEVHDNRTYGN